MQDDLIESYEDVGGTHAPSMDLLGLLVAVLRRWKLIAAITLCALVATYGFLKLVPSLYKSAVEILVYDPQQQIDTAVQKPISPFVDAVGFEAMNTEIEILRSKSVALRVAKELGLDKDPEFLPRDRLAVLAKWLKFLGLSRANGHDQAIGGIDGENTEKLDQAADALLERLQVWQESYIIFVSATSQDPIKAQRLASTIAKDYLASQREARQEALERVATWLKGRIDNLRARVLETEASIEKLKADSDIGDAEFNNAREQQIRDLNTALMTARERVDEKHARLEQARRVIDTNGDIQSIPELTASTTLTELRQRQTELTSLALDLQKRLGEHHARVIAVRAELAAVTQQINAEAEHIFGNMKNAYDIAVQQEQSLKANLQSLSAHVNSQTYTKLEQLRHAADVDRKLYQSYLSEYNDVSERRTLQDASSRIISPATLPRSPSSPRYKLFYAGGGMLGLGSGFLLAFLLEYLQSGMKTGAEIEESLGRPVLGIIPLMRERWVRTTTHDRLLHSMVDEPLSHLSEAVHAIRISLELSAANPKVILISSALPAEGKSTAAMLLATSSASSGKRTILLDCDLRQQSTSEAFRNKHHPGLSELLRGTAKLADVITKDPLTKAYVIPAGSMIPNPADWLMSQRMKDLISALRQQFDYIILDTSPLLPVVDALVLATLADKILVIVEWSQTPRASISEAFKILRPQAHRVAGIVLNKVDLSRLPGYSYRGGYYYRSTGGTSIALASGRPGRSFATIQADTEYQG